jgi:hypothetical protein
MRGYLSRGWIIVGHGIDDRGTRGGLATTWLKVSVTFSTKGMMRAWLATPLQPICSSSIAGTNFVRAKGLLPEDQVSQMPALIPMTGLARLHGFGQTQSLRSSDAA